MSKKFGPLSETQQQAVHQIDSMQMLDDLLLAVMDATTIGEMDLE